MTEFPQIYVYYFVVEFSIPFVPSISKNRVGLNTKLIVISIDKPFSRGSLDIHMYPFSRFFSKMAKNIDIIGNIRLSDCQID